MDVDGKRVLVVGAGGVALYIAQLARIRGGEVYVSTRSREKAKALSELGDRDGG